MNKKILATISSVGFELEGGTNANKSEIRDTLKKYRFLKDIKIDTDGSVFVDSREFSDREIKFWVYIEDFNKLYYVFNDLYNKCDFRQNNTCGNHVHIKLLNSNDYYKLFNYRTIVNFIQSYIQFAKSVSSKLGVSREKYLNRLNNGYCREIKNMNDLIKNFLGTRYYCVNFDSFYKHKIDILEFRIMPHAENAVEHLMQSKFLLNFVANVCLENCDIYSKRIRTNIKSDIQEQNEKLQKLLGVKLENLKVI